MLYFVTKGIDVRLNWDPLVRKILRCPMVQVLLLNETLEGLAMGWEYLWRGEIGTVPCFRDTGEDSFPVCLHTLKSLFGTSLHCVKVGPELKEHLEVMLATAGMQLQRTLLSHFYSLASFSCEEKSRCHPMNKLMWEETEVQCKGPCMSSFQMTEMPANTQLLSHE